MKIKIKSRKEIEKTLDMFNIDHGCYAAKKSTALFNEAMFRLCGKVFLAESISCDKDENISHGHVAKCEDWSWVDGWIEIKQPKHSQKIYEQLKKLGGIK